MTVTLQPEYALTGVNEVIEGALTIVRVEIVRSEWYDAMVTVRDEGPINVPAATMNDIRVLLMMMHDNAGIEGGENGSINLTETEQDD
jgi:hypothetical protein